MAEPEIFIRKEGRVGHVTLNRPKALNAITWEMVRAIDNALIDWAEDPEVAMLVIDALGERAFSAGGDIAEMYAAGRRGDFDYGRRFWTDEYRMNARLFHFPKPVASFMQGFTMGGGVGVGCHASHRVVGESSQVAMPECGIGLVPDVGGSWILGHAPGRLGEYLGVTGARMGPADAIHAGFADYFIPEADWPGLVAQLVETGDWSLIDAAAKAPPPGRLPDIEERVRFTFSGARLRDVVRALEREGDDFATHTLDMMRRNSPLSMACTLELVRRSRAFEDIRPALEMEYRFTSRAMEHGDFLEGIRAAIIDKDRKPRWKHASIDAVPDTEVTAMLMPLPKEVRVFREETT